MHHINGILILVACTLVSSPVLAQIIVDDQKIQNPSILAPGANQGSTHISGGTVRGQNLFHSFREFNIQKTESVLFNNSSSSSRLVIRVNGQNSSILNGILDSGGIGDILFVNPAGVSILGGFQPLQINNLNISTSEVVKFSDGFNLRSNSFISPSLSLSFPETFYFGSNSKNIFIKNTGLILETPFGNVITNNQPRKESVNVASNGRIFLSAANIEFSGGLLFAPDGNIILSAMKSGEINLNGTEQYGYGNIIRGNITIKDFSLLDNSGFLGGKIQIFGDIVSIESGSSLLSQNISNLFGSIDINANDFILSGVTEISPLYVSSLQNPLATATRDVSTITSININGAPSDININAKNIDIIRGGTIRTSSIFSGQGGDINLNSEKINIIGGGNVNEFFGDASRFAESTVVTSSFSDEASGAINIFSDSFSLLNGGRAFTISFSSGDAGKINVKTQDLIISGVRGDRQRSAISSSTFSDSSSGNIDVASTSILIEDGGTITTNSLGSGDTGDLNIQANEIKIDGSANQDFSTGISSIVTPDTTNTTSRELKLLDFELLGRRIDGNTGNVSVSANKLKLNQGVISVDNLGIGNAGKLSILTGNTTLIDSSIRAGTLAGNGGLIDINTDSLALLNSTISSDAQLFGSGGGVQLNTKLLITQGNSQITANAQQSNGGQVFIGADAVIGSANTIVSASSDLGPIADGTVNINTTQNQINNLDKPTLLEQPPVTLVEACNTSLSSVAQLGKGAGSEIVTDPQLLAASSLKKRLAYQSKFTYIDPDTGEEKPFKRWLGVQMRDDGMAEFVTDPSQSEVLQNLLSLLDKKCQVISNS